MDPAIEGIGLLTFAIYQFYGVSILCDEHLCPTLERLCDDFKVPAALAAASFLSFGSSAPEIIISVIGAADDRTELSIPAVLTSALIAFGAIPPIVVLTVGAIKLRVREVVRDAVAYAVVLICFLVLNSGSEFTSLSAAMLIVLYVGYLVLVYVTSEIEEDDDSSLAEKVDAAEIEAPTLRLGMRFRALGGKQLTLSDGAECYRDGDVGSLVNFHKPAGAGEECLLISWDRTGRTSAIRKSDWQHCFTIICEAQRVSKTSNGSSTSNGRKVSETLGFPDLVVSAKEAEKTLDTPLLSGATREGDGDAGEEDEEEAPPSCLAALLSKPFDVFFSVTMPSNVVAAFTISIGWLCLLSYGALVCAEGVCECFGLSSATAGVTLLAWGGQLPDTIAAVALAKSGMPDAAIAQAIASQVINVSIGLGGPILAFNLLTAKVTETENHMTIVIIAQAVLVSIVVYLLSVTPTCSSPATQTAARPARRSAVISRCRALGLAGCFLFLYIGIIILAEVKHRVLEGKST